MANELLYAFTHTHSFLFDTFPFVLSFTLELTGCLKCINNRAEKFVKSERSILQGASLARQFF